MAPRSNQPSSVPSPEPEDLSPAKRNPAINNAENWMRIKSKFDGIDPTLWRIKDGLYDLTAFADKHPGGAAWITNTRGSDITEAFEIAHVFGNANKSKTLEKYFVRSCSDIPRQSFYTFDDDGFYMTFKRRAQPILKAIGTGPTRQMLLIQDGLAITFHILMLLSILTQSLTLVVMAGVVLGMNVSSAHNFIHQKDSFRRFYFDLSMLSSNDARITHVMSHHIFPNSYHDFEVAGVYPLLDIYPNLKKTWIHRYLGPIYCHIPFLMLSPFTFINRIVAIISGVSPFRVENAIPLLQLVMFWQFSSLPAATAFWHWLLMHSLSGYWLVFTAITTTHHHPASYHAGDLHQDTTDFGLQQLDANLDVSCDNLFVAVTTLKHHSLHHMFPTVDHSKLPSLYPTLVKTCEEFGVKFEFMSLWSMFWGFHSQLMRRSQNSYEDRLVLKS